MARTDNFRKQHEEIFALARKIAGFLGEDISIDDANIVRSLALQLSGKVAMHLAMEDKAFYPALLDSSDPAVRAMARQYIDEMGPLAKTFNDYLARWSSASAIAAHGRAFSGETRDMFNLLSKRMERENSHLYKLVDTLR